jgi:hypothetical protein
MQQRLQDFKAIQLQYCRENSSDNAPISGSPHLKAEEKRTPSQHACLTRHFQFRDQGVKKVGLPG